MRLFRNLSLAEAAVLISGVVALLLIVVLWMQRIVSEEHGRIEADAAVEARVSRETKALAIENNRRAAEGLPPLPVPRYVPDRWDPKSPYPESERKKLAR